VKPHDGNIRYPEFAHFAPAQRFRRLSRPHRGTVHRPGARSEYARGPWSDRLAGDRRRMPHRRPDPRDRGLLRLFGRDVRGGGRRGDQPVLAPAAWGFRTPGGRVRGAGNRSCRRGRPALRALGQNRTLDASPRTSVGLWRVYGAEPTFTAERG